METIFPSSGKSMAAAGAGEGGGVQRLRLVPCIRHSSVGIFPAAIYRRTETDLLPFGILRIWNSETELFLFWYANRQNSLDFVRLPCWLNVSADPATSCWHGAQVGVFLWKFRRKYVSPKRKQHDQIYKFRPILGHLRSNYVILLNYQASNSESPHCFVKIIFINCNCIY